MKYIDLTHTFVDNMPAYFGDPSTTLKQITTIEQNGYVDHELKTVMHVGTHMDAPLHMIDGGKYMDEIPLDCFTGSGILLDVRGINVIDTAVLSGVTLPKHGIVLLYTGLSDTYGTKEYEKTPEITQDFAHAVVDAKIRIVGMDFLNPDIEESFPIHKILLSHKVLIIENLTNLGELAGEKDFEVFAFPMKLHAEAAPVRVVAAVK